MESQNSETTPTSPLITAVKKVKQNLTFRSKWAELNGAMGDLGTYIPIVLALTLAKDLNLGTTLIFTGLYNFVTGVVYGVPMPVQPMKSIAAAAITSPDFGIPEVMAAGICTGAILFLLGLTGLMRLVYRLIPLPVVRGIQLAQGLSFAMTAVKYVQNEQNFAKSKSGAKRHWLGLDGLLLALVCASLIIAVNGAGDENDDDIENDKRGESGHGEYNLDDRVDEVRVGKRRRLRRIISSLPSAFIIFLLGVILAFIRKPSVVKGFKFGPSGFEVVKLSKHAWKEGFIKGTIPQLPLSVLNSVIAVCKLSSDLFPGKDVSAIGCWFGAMPCCHGAGGLAGQYKFGGRSGGCVALLGAAKLVLGLVLGSSLVKILSQFPVGVLGVLLLFAGIELAMCARDMNSKEDAFVMLLCTAVSLVGSSAAKGFVCSLLVYLLLRLRKMDGKQSWSDFWLNRNP